MKLYTAKEDVGREWVLHAKVTQADTLFKNVMTCAIATDLAEIEWCRRGSGFPFKFSGLAPKDGASGQHLLYERGVFYLNLLGRLLQTGS